MDEAGSKFPGAACSGGAVTGGDPRGPQGKEVFFFLPAPEGGCAIFGVVKVFARPRRRRSYLAIALASFTLSAWCLWYLWLTG